MGLKVGDVIPNFKAKDANGNDFDSENIVGKKPLVIYFYPKDNTPGCTAEACSFRDQYEDFKDLRNCMYEDKTFHRKYLQDLNFKIEEIEEELLTVFDPTPIIW